MRHINEIASWYKKNNQLCNEDIRTNLLCLYTIVAYKIKNIDLEYKEISFSNDSFNIGITDYNLNTQFDENETKILKTINRLYGYLEISNLFYNISIENPSINKIIDKLEIEIKEDLESYQEYDFNEYVVIKNNNTYFVNNDTVLSDEELKYLENYHALEQNQFTVFRDTNNKLVIY